MQQGKEESARVRVENIIRSDIDTELLEILELYCELLLARTRLLDAKECDPGLEEAIKSIIYAAPRTDIKELQQARLLLVEKYGKEFALDAVENRDGKVAERVLKKLRVEAPDPELVTLYLMEIAKTYGVPWPKTTAPPPTNTSNDQPCGGQTMKALEMHVFAEGLGKAKPPRDFGPGSSVRVASPSPRTENAAPTIQYINDPNKSGSNTASEKESQTPTTDAKSTTKTADTGGSKNVVGGRIPDVDELSKRFAALKR